MSGEATSETTTQVASEVTAGLLLRYSRPGPRYTSYPTAPEFSPGFGPNDYRVHLEAADRGQSGEPLSLYVHLPFCASLCTFCGCTVIIARRHDKIERYLGTLERELEMVAALLPRRRRLSQMHWGGGTPNQLSEEEMERLFRLVTARFEILPDAEVALEIDPRTVRPGQIAFLRSLGFNRVSMGIQDFTPEVQQAANRIQPEAMTREVLGACRREGFASINVDLIYGLPRQTPQTFQQTIDAIVDMRPDRIAVFHFAYVPWLKPQQRRIDEQTLPPTPVRMELFLRALRSFTAAGYLQIGMDHFALPDDELARARLRGVLGRNFQGYTVKPPGDLIGLGMSSISEVQGAYAQNEHVLGKYTAAIEEGRFATQRGIGLSNDDRLRRHVIHGLLCNFALDIGEVERRFGIGWDETFAEEEKALREHVDAGFVVRGPGRIEVTEVGRLFIRNICMVFDRYLRRPAEGKQVFSRTL